jgi:hypothetical protein
MQQDLDKEGVRAPSRQKEKETENNGSTKVTWLVGAAVRTEDNMWITYFEITCVRVGCSGSLL